MRVYPQQQYQTHATWDWESRFDRRLLASNLAVGLVLTLGFLARIWAASGTFLHPDEALHFRVANQVSLALAYRSSLTISHPPLLVLILYFWRDFGTSELVLRLPLVIAGTLFCWVFYKWLSSILGQTAGWIGLIFVTFLPSLIELSSQIRQYALLLFFLACTLYFLERALAENSAGMMLVSSVCLYAGMLSHYSAFVFAAPVGGYCVLRFCTQRYPTRVVVTWAAGQIGGLGLALFLYLRQLSKLGRYFERASAFQRWEDWTDVRQSYFDPNHDHVATFIYHQTFGVFRFIFGQHLIGDSAAVMFIVAVALLLRSKSDSECKIPCRYLGTLLLLAFVVSCGAAVAGKYPYGRIRHSIFLAIFGIAGVSFLLAKLVRQRLGRGVALALVMTLICRAFGTPQGFDTIASADQSRLQMALALDFIGHHVTSSDVIFMDHLTELQFGHYLCLQKPISFDDSVAGFETFRCDGYKVISTDRKIGLFDPGHFLSSWEGMRRAYDLRAGQAVWVIQAGLGGDLANQLRSRFPEFSDLNSISFGHHIQIFKLTVGQSGIVLIGH